MGILDNKSRIVDTVITNEGRRQLASGKMKIEYYTFTDGEVFYQSSSSGITDDATSRFYFEAPFTLPSDQITFEADDSGRLLFDNNPELKVVNGNISKTTLINDSLISDILSGSVFASTTATLLTSSLDSFKNLRVISTIDRLFGDEDGFSLSENSWTVRLSDGTNLFKKRDSTLTISAKNIPDFIGERKLSKSINFMWLPPTRNLPPGVKMGNLSRIQQRSYSLGQYENFSPPMIDSDYLENGEDYNVEDNNPYNNTNFNGINYSNQKGFSKEINFYSSPQSKKMVMQVFEVTSGKNEVRKLDVIDAGNFNLSDSDKVSKVFFVGRVFYDAPRYVFANIFTLVFE